MSMEENVNITWPSRLVKRVTELLRRPRRHAVVML